MAIQTYGELRQALLRENLEWTVNPAFSDSTPIARHSLGAFPGSLVKADPRTRVDVAALLRLTPPTVVSGEAGVIEAATGSDRVPPMRPVREPMGAAYRKRCSCVVARLGEQRSGSNSCVRGRACGRRARRMRLW